jgi:TolB-like protein
MQTERSSAGRAPRRVRWPVLVSPLAVLILLAGAAALWPDLAPRPQPPAEPSVLQFPAEPSLMVFPFDDLGPGGANDYLGRGIAEEIAVRLAASPRLRLVSNRTLSPYLAEAEDPGRLARELGVDLLMTGSVRALGDSIELTAKLSDARTAELVWISTFNRPPGDIFEIQDEVAAVIADMLLQGESLPGRAAPTPNLAAYDYYLQGREYLARIDAASTAQAVTLFRRALSLDLDFAPARSSLAQALALQGSLHQQGASLLSTALEQADAAIALNDGLADAHYARALAQMGLGRFEDSRADILRAIALSPNHIDAVYLGGLLSDFRGQLAEAVRYFQRAQELNPRFSQTVALARTMLLLGREAQALEVGRRGDQLAPGVSTLHFAHVLTLAGEHEEALMMCSEALAREVPRARNLCGFSALLAGETGLAVYLLSEDWQEDPKAQWGPFAFAPSATHLALLRQADGDWAAADELLNQSEAVTLAARAAGNDHWALSYNLAAVAALRGDAARAAEWLDTAYRNGFRDHRLLNLDPALDLVRFTPAYLDLQSRIGNDMAQAAQQLGWGQ